MFISFAVIPRIQSSNPFVPYRLWLFGKRSCFTALEKLGSIDLAEQLDQLGNDTCPASLVARPQASAVISVKVLVEQDVILPVRIGLEFLRSSVHRPPAGFILQEDSG